jgi:hypothetical protein
MMHMRRGDFTAAWEVSDAILRRRISDAVTCDDWPRHLQFIWKGQSLADQRVLVRCYHGLGDTLQFVRLLAPLREEVREVILWAQPCLLGLLESVTGSDRLLPLSDGAPGVSYDVDIELMELPHILRLTADRIPARVPYIYVRQSEQRRADSDSLHVGLVWRSGDWIAQRSIPDALLAELARVPGVHWHSLQYPTMPLPFEMENLACADIVEFARRMSALDLVISVDTMAAHLAGALGMQVWTLLRKDCDWRWMEGRSDTPWYPTMQLFRQRRVGDWRDVVEEVIAALTDTVQRCAVPTLRCRAGKPGYRPQASAQQKG